MRKKHTEEKTTFFGNGVFWVYEIIMNLEGGVHEILCVLKKRLKFDEQVKKQP